MIDLFDEKIPTEPTAAGGVFVDGVQIGDVTCANCGCFDYFQLRWQDIAGGRKHLRCDCGVCGKFVKFVPQSYWKKSWDLKGIGNECKD